MLKIPLLDAATEAPAKPRSGNERIVVFSESEEEEFACCSPPKSELEPPKGELEGGGSLVLGDDEGVEGVHDAHEPTLAVEPGPDEMENLWAFSVLGAPPNGDHDA